jgi:purine catabolism regulator
MGILLSELLKISCFKDAKLLSGIEESKNTCVKGITIIERPDIVDWTKGGELLLTTFYSIDKDLDAQKSLINGLAMKGAAALIIKTSKFLPTIPNQIIGLGVKLGFPIIEIPQETKYIDILYPVMSEIFNDQVNKLNYYKNCHEKFTELSLKMKGIPSIAKTLKELIDNPVMIFDSELSSIAYSDEEYKEIEIVDRNMRNLIVNDHFVYGLNAKLKDDEDIYTIIVEPIQGINNIKVYLGIIEKNRLLHDLDFIAIQSAATSLRLEMLKDVAINEVELKYKGNLIDDLINGKFDSLQNIYDRSNLLGWNLKRRFVVILLTISQYEDYIRATKSSYEELILLREKIKTIVDRISYQYIDGHISINKGDDIIILWPVEKIEDLKNIYIKIKKFGIELRTTILNKIGNILLLMGISGLAQNPTEIGQSFTQAKDALNYGYKIFGKDSITIYEELGIYKLLCSYKNRDELIKFVPSPLLILKEYDKDKNNELIDTLEMYLACNLNAAKTAEELFVHYKTILYRLNRIKEITNLDIEDRRMMLEIEVGLKILRIIV